MSPILLCGLRRRWKIGALACLLVFCGIGLFSGLAWGLALGAIVGIALPMLLEYLDRTIKRVDDVCSKLGMTVLTTLPRLPLECHQDGQPERRLITSFSPQEPAVEAYHDLCSSLESFGDGEKGQVIMVTSCIPGEGKSTVSANLSVTLANQGAKVLLVGCDLRRPTLCELFGETHQPGLSDLLSGDDVTGLRKLTHPAIDFLPAGNIPLNPAELLCSDRMREYLTSIRKDYDYVVLDAPPVLAVTDAQLLAPLCDLRLMVMEPCRIPLPMAKTLIETLQSVGAKIDGVVLNDRSGRAARHYGGFGEYGRTAGTVSSRQSPVVTAGQVSPLGKFMVANALLLAVVIAGLSWKLMQKEEAPPAIKLPAVAGQPVLPESEQTRPVSQVPVVEARAVVKEEILPPTKLSAPTKPPIVQVIAIQENRTPRHNEPEPGSKPDKSPKLVDLVSQSETTAPTDVLVVTEQISSKQTVRAEKTVQTETQRKAQPQKKAKPVDKGLQDALASLARSWQRTLPKNMKSNYLDVEDGLKEMGFLSSSLGPNLSASLQCDTPLLLETRKEQTGTTWIAVIGRRGYKWQVTPATRQGELLSELDLKKVWTGKGYLPWQDPLELIALDGHGDDPKRMAALQGLLVKAGYLEQFERGIYDRETIKALGRVQADAGLAVKGKITPETLVLLYQADPEFKTPKFSLW